MYFAAFSQFRYAYLHKSILVSQQFFLLSLGDTFKSELCNYRPVTLTCIICKLVEKEVIEITY